MIGKWRRLVVVLICTAVLPGCWSQNELNDLALVFAIGLDLTEKGEYEMSVQVVNPGNVAGATQRGGGAGGVPYTVISATGDSPMEANLKMSLKLSRILYYGHANLVVIGEFLARKGVAHALDALERNSEFRTTSRVVIARGQSAKETLKVLTPIAKVSSNQIQSMLSHSQTLWGHTVEIDVWELFHDIYSTGISSVVSGINIVGNRADGAKQTNVQSTEPEARLVLDGLGVFKQGKLDYWIPTNGARGVLWIMNKVRQTNITVAWQGKPEAIGYHIVRTNVSVRPHMKNGKPSIKIRVEALGDILETLVPVNLADADQINRIEKLIEHSIWKELTAAVRNMKERKTDVFGFGEQFERNYPKDWRKLEADWFSVHFPQLDVSVEVNAIIRTAGLRIKPFKRTVELGG